MVWEDFAPLITTCWPRPTALSVDYTNVFGTTKIERKTRNVYKADVLTTLLYDVVPN